MRDKKYKLYKNGLPKKIISLVASATMFLEVFGGNVANIVNSPVMGTMEALASTYYEPGEEEPYISIPDSSIYEVKWAIETAMENFDYFNDNDNDNIKVSDLKKIKSLDLTADSLYCDMSWLTYCENLEDLTIYINEKNVDKLRNIDFSHVKRLQLSSQISADVFTLKEDDFRFLEKYHFDELYLSVLTADMGNSRVLSKINADTLCIHVGGFETKINYDALTNINNLEIGASYPYDIPINLSNEQIKKLESRGINVRFDLDSEEYNDYVACSKKLDKVYKGLGISDNDSDNEKINKILIYVLDNFEYDPVIASKLANGEEHLELSRKMYEEGGLTPFMNDAKYFICGNYSALFSALLAKANVDSYIISSDTHAWNLVEVDGEYYYFDATWLEEEKGDHSDYEYDDKGRITSQTIYSIPVLELIRNNETIPEDVWYQVLINDAESLDPSGDHKASYIPNYVDLSAGLDVEENVEDTKNAPDISNKKFKIKVGAKEYIIAGSVLVAMMTAFGTAIAIGKKKRKRKQQVQTFINPYSTTSFNPENYGGSNSEGYGGFKF